MRRIILATLALAALSCAASAQIVGGPRPACSAFGTSAGTCVQGAGDAGTPSAIVLTNGTGLPIAGTTGYGTGVATALGINVGSAGAPVTNGGALGTPSSGVLSSTTGYRSQIVTATYNLTTASGTQDFTFAFTPTSCQGFASVAGSVNQYITTNAVSDSAANQYNVYWQTTPGNISTSTFFIATDTTGTNFQLGTISYGLNKATITWAKTGSPTGTLTEVMKCSP